MADQYEYSEFVPDVHFELIPIKMLVSNQTYQRPISAAHVGRTAQHFNVYQINPVKVSRRDGNLANFHAPFGIDFTQMEFFDIAKEHIIGHFPENYEANAVIEAFYKALPEELQDCHSHISEYYTHFECAGPKLAHYTGYMLGNRLLPWLEPGYRVDTIQTMKYEREMENYCGYLPI